MVWKSAPTWVLANIVLSVFRSLLPLILIWLIRNLIDQITHAASSSPDSTVVNLIWSIITVVIIWFLDEASADIGNYVRRQQAAKLESYMYDLLHTKSVKLDLINFERSDYFNLLSRSSKEAPWRPNSILNNIISLSRGLISLLLMAGLLVTLHWSMALLLIIFNIPGIWLRIHYSGILYNFRKQQTPESRKAAYFNWLLTGDRPSREIRLFGLGEYFKTLFNNSLQATNEKEILIIRKRSIVDLLSDLFKAAAVLIIIMFITRQTINGNISLGQMAMFMVAFRQGMIYIKDLLGSLASLYEDSLFIGDVFDFFNLEERISTHHPEKVISGFNKNIIVENLSFTYPGNALKTIDCVTFEIKKGEIVALVGPNGAGKSTLVKLICRLYDPDSGSIKIDGDDIRYMDPDRYRKLLSVLFQDFMLYNLTAGENIRLGDISKEDPEEINRSASITGIDKVIEKLPGNYSAPIGNLFEDSHELSWGEWQKFALSRAFFRDAPLLILDEPSSALDADTEYEIFSRVREIVKGRTAILISHRLTNISNADRIIVLDRGTITEMGSHDELIQKKGIYHSMYVKQTSRFK